MNRNWKNVNGPDRNGEYKRVGSKMGAGPNKDLMVKFGNKCQNCGELGHWKADCKKSTRNVCFTCRQPGHWARDCPFNIKNKSK